MFATKNAFFAAPGPPAPVLHKVLLREGATEYALRAAKLAVEQDPSEFSHWVLLADVHTSSHALPGWQIYCSFGAFFSRTLLTIYLRYF